MFFYKLINTPKKYKICNFFSRYEVSTPELLYSAFDNILADKGYELENDLSVTEFMKNWTTQSGYPCLTIMKNETSNEFVLIQVITLSI